MFFKDTPKTIERDPHQDHTTRVSELITHNDKLAEALKEKERKIKCLLTALVALDQRLSAAEGTLAAAEGERDNSRRKEEDLRAQFRKERQDKYHAVANAVTLSGSLERMREKLKDLEDALTSAAQLRLSESKKRSLEHDDDSGAEASSKDRARKERKKATPRMRPCTVCYTHKWNCDGKAHCINCILLGKTLAQCKRVKCQKFGKGSCKKQVCTLVHEDDGYTNLVPFTKLRQTGGVPPPSASRSSEKNKISGE